MKDDLCIPLYFQPIKPKSDPGSLENSRLSIETLLMQKLSLTSSFILYAHKKLTYSNTHRPVYTLACVHHACKPIFHNDGETTELHCAHYDDKRIALLICS